MKHKNVNFQKKRVSLPPILQSKVDTEKGESPANINETPKPYL